MLPNEPQGMIFLLSNWFKLTTHLTIRLEVFHVNQMKIFHSLNIKKNIYANHFTRKTTIAINRYLQLLLGLWGKKMLILFYVRIPSLLLMHYCSHKPFVLQLKPRPHVNASPKNPQTFVIYINNMHHDWCKNLNMN